MHAEIVNSHMDETAKSNGCLARILQRTIGLLLALLLVSSPSVASGAAETIDQDCPNEPGWKPSKSKLEIILNQHKDWISQEGRNNTGITGRANLCNADLKKANLAKASLQGANLNQADLRYANLERSSLTSADLVRANLTGAYLKGANLSGANLKDAVMFRPNFPAAGLFDPFGSFTISVRRLTNLSETDLRDADLGDAELTGVNFTEASLIGVNLQGARLRNAKLVGANLSRAKLNETDLSGADLQASKLHGTDLVGAVFTGANLTDTHYEPVSAPSNVHLSGLKGIKTLQFGLGGQTGVVLLRKALQEAGLRQLEREATYAIEHGVNNYALEGHGDDAKYDDFDRIVSKDIGAIVEGALKLVFFEWTTDWGVHPGRALLILLVGIEFFSIFYLWALFPREFTFGAGVYREWPQGRIVESVNPQGTGWTSAAAKDDEIERLQPEAWRKILFALYFSLLSAFNIGWRDLNVGTWLTKLQFKEYGLRARGWARFVSGFQSLVSVYLVAIAVLTYFGRPFQ